RGLPPAVGFPIPVRSDGTVSLPLIAPVSVQGLSVEQAQEAIRDAYIKSPEAKPILQPGRERVLVSLMRRRVEQILVFRQDAAISRTAWNGSSCYGTRKRCLRAVILVGSPDRGTGSWFASLSACDRGKFHLFAQKISSCIPVTLSSSKPGRRNTSIPAAYCLR